MKNNQLFVLNPGDNNLVNDGVVNINTAQDDNGLKTVRHELKTFVCEGEYEAGLLRILDTYLRFIDQPKQPAVWVSGFFGSGKSHLIKMLKLFWEDFEFPDGDTARKVKELPFSIKEKLVELDRKQKIHGKLAISGTLKDFPSNDIRYSFLQLLLNALDLPQQYHHFKFVYWAKQEGILEDLRSVLESQNKVFDKELENLFVSAPLAKAVLQLKPEFAETEAKARETFKAQFKRVEHVDRNQLLSTIKDEVLPMFYGDKVPCTVIVLDEVQQFIGQDASKTIDIQNLAQDVCDHFDGKFLLIGSGQNALAETPQLSPLKDRFSVTVSLSDTDVDAVTRKTVLEKKPSAVPALQKSLETALGEISRNLSGTSFGYTTADKETLVADYPILPSTRKFWKKVLQLIDTAGTSGQLRSQLRIVDESLKLVATENVGVVVPADFVFEQKRGQLLSNAILLNETNNLIMERKAKGGDSLLEGRIISVVFLLDQLPKDLPGGSVLSNEETIADALINDLTVPSDAFRNKVKDALKRLLDEKILMPIGTEYKLQTKVGAEWEQEYKAQAVKLGNSGDDIVNRFRRERFMTFLSTKTKQLNILQGTSKERRDFDLWDRQERPDTSSKLYTWIRDGWNEAETVVINEIRSEGTDSSLSYLFIPKERDQDLKSEIIKHLASKATLEAKGIPSSLEGEQAMKSMETRRGLANQGVNDLIERICKEAKVYLAGGSLIESGSLVDNLREALNSSADRQFSEFKGKADYVGWDKALTQAQGNNPDALKKINYSGEAKDHPVGIEMLRFIGNGTKQGREIRSQFMKSPYGWSQDAVDAMIFMLRLTEILSSTEQDLKPANINTSVFKKEIHTLTASHKLKLRGYYQDAGIHCKPGSEFSESNTYLARLQQLAEKISGDAPLLAPINTTFLDEISNLDGNERLLRIVQEGPDLKAKWSEWNGKAALVDERFAKWEIIEGLQSFLPIGHEDLSGECDAIRDGRLLFQKPDVVQPLLERLTAVINDALGSVQSGYLEDYELRMAQLQSNEHFKDLKPEEKRLILLHNQLLHEIEIKKYDARGLLNHLRKISLDAWKTKTSALSGQFQTALEEAVKLSAPKAEFYTLPKRNIKSDADIQKYVDDIKAELTELLKKAGSIILK
jgi:hypothetical protein